MSSHLTPEGASSWFKTFYVITEKSTPITMIFIVAFMVTGYIVTKREIRRLHDVNQQLWVKVQQQNVEMIKIALDCHKMDN